MKLIIKIIGFFLTITILSGILNIYADEKTITEKTVVILQINNEESTKEFCTLGDAINYINEKDNIDNAIISIIRDCYVDETLKVNPYKNIQVVAKGNRKIYRQINKDTQNTVFWGALFETEKFSTLTFGKIGGMGDGNALVIDGGAEWDDSNLSVNNSIKSEEALIKLSHGIINLYDGVKIQNNHNVTSYGGAIYVQNGILNMYGGSIENNCSSFGGAIFIDNGDLNLFGGKIISNKSIKLGNVFVKFGASLAIKGKISIIDNIDNENVYLENTYINIVGKIDGTIGISSSKRTLSTLLVYAKDEQYLDIEKFIYDSDLESYGIYVFNDNTIRIGAKTKIFFDMPTLNIFEYNEKVPNISYYIKEYSELSGKIINLPKCEVNFYERDGNIIGKKLENAPLQVGDYYVEIIYKGSTLFGYSPCSNIEKFSISVIPANTDNLYYKISFENADERLKPLIACIDIVPVDDIKISNGISVSKNIISNALNKANKFMSSKKVRDISLKIRLVNNQGSLKSECIKIVLDHNSINKILNYNVKSLYVETNNTYLEFNYNSLYTIYNETENDIIINIEKLDKSKLTNSMKKIIYKRPVYNYSVYYNMVINGRKAVSYINDFDFKDVEIGIKYDMNSSIIDKIDKLRGLVKDNNRRQDSIFFVIIDDNNRVVYCKNYDYEENSKYFILKTDKLGIVGLGRNNNSKCYRDTVNHWAEIDIDFMIELGIFSGYNNDTFLPNNEMTRGMFVTVLGRLARLYLDVDVDLEGSVKSGFEDVDENKYYTPYIEWAVKANIATGVGNNNFSPDKPITREEMSVMMYKFAQYSGYEIPVMSEKYLFNDVNNFSNWSKEAIFAMQQAGIINGTGNFKFKPKGTATRAQVSAVLRRFMEIIIYK
ncbi:S-layer homology domain-containing protein [Sedimentibacter sp. zth1]|uniref:S-layer homology domain-containing protein n=1 Tax=Sedimentibacter sp. zth1 TaxID=2816908 RepID=UPI001A924290|nr:S-layer homology domain-containing protein [Sedimentibacter sp. zth1]QSX06623.1 S-layer homology domain-containing protein [Sedimentibacter sp. zth1]